MEKESKDPSTAQPPPPQPQTWTPTKLYLILYNTISLLLWSVLFVQATIYLLHHRTHIGMYTHLGSLLRFTQTVQCVEILHAALGLVNSSVLVNVNHIMGRNMTMWIYLHYIVMSDVTTQGTIGFPLLLFGWSVSELVRYSFYLCGFIGVECACVKWARYSFFTFLFPIGGSGEFIVIYESLSVTASRRGLLSLALPNVANVSFCFYSFTILVLCCVVPSISKSYLHMLRQRRKALAKKKEE